MKIQALVRTFVLALMMMWAVGLAQDDVSHYGTVSLSSVGVMGVDQTVGSAAFYALTDGAAFTSDDALYPADRLDRCFEAQEDELTQPALPETDLPFDQDATIPAGSELVIEADGSSFMTLARQGDTYVGRVQQPLPTNATVSIPGSDDGFPAFDARAFPQPRPLELTAPADVQAIDATTTFRWEPVDARSVVLIVMQGDTGGGPSGGIVCFAEDDGEFSLAESAGLENVTPRSVVMYGRNVTTTYREGSAVLALTVMSTTLAMQMPEMPAAPN